MLLTLESMTLPVCLLCPERPLWPPHPPTRCHYLSAYHLGISYHVLPTKSLFNASLGLILSNIWDSLSIRRELILNFPSDVWTSLLICATLPGHPLPSLLQLQGSQKQECEGVSILRIANHRAIYNTPIAGMSSGWCTGSSTHSLLHLNQSWIHSLLSGKKKQRHNEGREGGKCFFPGFLSTARSRWSCCSTWWHRLQEGPELYTEGDHSLAHHKNLITYL